MCNDLLVNIFEDGLFAAIAAIGFSSISNTPRRAYLTCALIAAAGHSIRYVISLPDFGGMNIIISSTLAAFAIGILAVVALHYTHSGITPHSTRKFQWSEGAAALCRFR